LHAHNINLQNFTHSKHLESQDPSDTASLLLPSNQNPLIGPPSEHSDPHETSFSQVSIAVDLPLFQAQFQQEEESNSPRQEELKEDDTQITGQHRQITIQ
jgi:hypothetical protein